MPSDSSFDVVSRVDQQELDNALNQARKEVEGRFDFKNTKTEIDYDGKAKIAVLSDDELEVKERHRHHSVQGHQARHRHQGV